MIAVGGIQDQVHVLLKMPTTVAIAEIVKSLKGGSTHVVTHAVQRGSFFKWQGSYGAFTVPARTSPWSAPTC